MAMLGLVTGVIIGIVANEIKRLKTNLLHDEIKIATTT